MENQSLGYYLNQLSLKRSEDILEINESIERDYIFQALALELDKEQYPPVIRAFADGYEDFPIVGNIFASRLRIAELLGEGGEKNVTSNWLKIERNPIRPVIVPKDVYKRQLWFSPYHQARLSLPFL